MKRVLITGGAGFIGSHLAERLLADHEVVILDSFLRDALQYADFRGHPRLRLIQGDVLDPSAVRSAAEGCQVALHLAAIAGVSSYYRSPLRTMQVNLIGTMNLLEVLADSRSLELYVDFSTSEIYGDQALGVSESSPTTQGAIDDPRWTYAISKLASEKLGYCYYWERKLPAAAIRPFNVYGPRQVGEGVVSCFARAALSGEPLRVTGDGSQTRALCYIDDFVDGCLAILAEPKKAAGKSFNIGNPEGCATVLEIARAIIRLSGSASPIEQVPHIGSDIRDRSPDVTRMKEWFGYSPRIGLEEGLRRTIEWERERAARAG